MSENSVPIDTAYSAASVEALTERLAARYGLTADQLADYLASPPTSIGMRLEETCWNSAARGHIKQASEAMNSSPEAVLHAVLSRVSALVGPSVQVDTVIDQPASLNVIAALIGAPGTGKGRAIRHAASLLPFPSGPDLEEIGLTTGEGLIEAYIGLDEITGMRVQTRERVFAATTEAEVLAQCVTRSGNTLRPHLCSAWMGEALITSTADPERRRKVQAEQYRFAAVMAAQPDVADLFLSGGYLGLPQRMAWAPGTRAPGTRIAREQRPPWPGELLVSGESLSAWLDGLCDVLLVLPDEAVGELDDIALALEEGRGADRPLDTHEPLWKAKYAALLTLLDGETTIRMVHWRLACVLWDASCAQRDALLLEAAARRRMAREADEDARLRSTARANRMRLMMSDGVSDLVQRVAKTIAKKVVASEVPLKTAQLKDAVSSRDKEKASKIPGASLLPDAREYAVAMGWIIRNETGHWISGSEDID